jgi:hypothetical protein
MSDDKPQRTEALPDFVTAGTPVQSYLARRCSIVLAVLPDGVICPVVSFDVQGPSDGTAGHLANVALTPDLARRLAAGLVASALRAEAEQQAVHTSDRSDPPDPTPHPPAGAPDRPAPSRAYRH